jgi:hypothetical protein
VLLRTKLLALSNEYFGKRQVPDMLFMVTTMRNLIGRWGYYEISKYAHLKVFGIVLLLSFISAHAEPHQDSYQIQFNDPSFPDGSKAAIPPANGSEAVASFDARSDTILKYLGCGQEADFLDGATLRNRPDGDNPKFANAEDIGEGMLHKVLAKMLIYSSWPNHATNIPGTQEFRCRQHAQYYLRMPKKNPTDPDVPDIKAINNPKFTLTQSKIIEMFGEECAGVVENLNIGLDGFVTVDYSLSRECLRSQINHYLRNAYVDGIVGSSDLPCFPVPIGLTSGEWDVILKELTRVYFINDNTGRDALDEKVRIHIRNDLLTLDGSPGQESYNLGECGNQEHSLGSPEERANERNWTQNALDDVGDAWGWLGKWLLRLAVLALGLAVAFEVLAALVGAALAGAIVAGAAALGAITITFGDFPESENHRLMIESSRYLNNQIIRSEINPNDSNSSYISDDQTRVREWLLKRLQRIVKEDFVEYNTRPYQRYSLAAIRNLADFAQDPAISMAARNVLDLSAAKMALGSNQGRRLVPYRRLMEVMQTRIERNGHDVHGDLVYNGLFDLESGADHQIGLMFAYTGQTQQSPNGKMTPSAIDDMQFAVTSPYRPPEALLDLAIDKKTPYQQYFKHAAAEIYLSTEGYLLTAGGIQSGPSSTIELRGISVGGSILGLIPLSNNKDRGAAVPTTLMLSAGNDRSSLETFMRIAGARQRHDSDNASYDHNLCVYKGFACDLNIRTPPDMEACFVPGPSGTPDQWRFFDSKQCAPFQSGPQVMIARYIESCHGDQTGDCADNVGSFSGGTVPGNIGLFEALSNPDVDFITFQNRILQNNPSTANWLEFIGGTFGSNRTILAGKYGSFSGDIIVFNTSGHQLDSDRTGIVSINGVVTPKISEWSRASGDILSIDGKSGVCKFTHPITHHGFNINMSDWSNPQRGDF